MTGLEHELRDEVDKHSGATEALGFQAIEMESIQDELKSSEELARLIGGELEVLKVELSAPDRVRLIQEAKAPGAVDPSRLVKTAGMAGGGTFGAILFLISFLEFRRSESVRSTTSNTSWASRSLVLFQLYLEE